MASLLKRKLIVVTGKGGAGKSTIAGAFGLLGARSGLRTIVVELGEKSHLASTYAVPASPGREIELEPGLWSLSLDPDLDLIEWMRDLGGRFSARVLASSSSFQYLAAAAPGARELVSLVKLHRLSVAEGGRYDLVVFDAPASGHALAMLASPQTLTAIVRSSPLTQRAVEVQEMLEDPRHTGYVAVALATEMAISETLELEQGLGEQLGRNLNAVIVNARIARRFTSEELAKIESLAGREPSPAVLAAARAAHTTSERARIQRGQIARLRRQRAASGRAPDLVSVPFEFVARIDRDALKEIAVRLGRGLRLDA